MGAAFDVAVVGAGAVGASVALHLAMRGVRVAVAEKEGRPALHQSGRNSGVLHAGYNLKPGSEKARFCAAGNREARAWCRRHGVPLNETGAFVLALDEAQIGTLRELERRAAANGVAARIVDRSRLRETEPAAAGIAALHAPEVASFDARTFVESVVREAKAAGASFLHAREATSIEEDAAGVRVRCRGGEVAARIAVNASGLQADRLAGALAGDLRILPFRGTYAELVPARSHLVRTHLYPAPDLAFPFLGVHLSRRTDGRVLAGPGAIPVLGREAYAGWRAPLRDAWEVVSWPGTWRLGARGNVRRHVRGELARSMSLRSIARAAAALVPGLRPADLRWSPAGHRAQLVSRAGELVDDIVVRSTPRTVHVLNAVSPGLTCSLPFGRHLAEEAMARLESA